ncbi:unnamed protein product [Allacma fusca]|uniref:Uncharacterized protein n=1 Tax=Allacma fusca TaxID=39272 RepID=A0A8J2K6F1_9HEXA|nr:unnamed protein product [Allacma fusca]
MRIPSGILQKYYNRTAVVVERSQGAVRYIKLKGSSSRSNWQIGSAEHSTGTSLVAAEFDGGMVIGADSRTIREYLLA